MQKMVQFVPADPTVVLALEITEESWPFFLRLLGTDSPPFEKSTALGGMIVVPVDSEATWGWMNKTDFLDTYTPSEPEYTPHHFLAWNSK